MGDPLLVEVGGVVVIAPHERYPVVCLAESSRILVVDALVVTGPVEAEAAVAGNNQERVRHPVLDTEPVHEGMEVPVDVSADDDVLGVGVFEKARGQVVISLRIRTRRPLAQSLPQEPS